MHVVIIAGTDRLEGGSLLADTVVGGISLLTRSVRCAQRAGATQITVLTPSELHEDQLAKDRQVTAEVTVRRHEHPLAEASLALGSLGDGLRGEAWVTTTDRMISPQLFTGSDPGRLRVVDAQGRDTGVYRVDLDALAVQGSLSLGEVVDALPAVESIQAPKPLWHIVRTAQDRRDATDLLIASLRKPLGRNADGVTAYFVNRPISLRMSRVLVSTFITPNHITTIGLLMGLVAALLASSTEWSMLLAAGFLLQLSSIIDGVDGELARMRLTSSHSGEWYDTVVDDVINVAFMVGLGIGASRVLDASWPIAYGVGSAVLSVVVIALMYSDLLRAGLASHNNAQWGFEKEEAQSNPLARLVGAIAYLGKRDSYNLLIALILAANLPYLAFMIMATGANVISVAFLVQKAVRAMSAGAAESATAE